MLLSGALFAASCATKENPAAKCSTGTCTDPAAPFCDVDGTVGGTPGSCLAVNCTAGEFKACRGDVALTCNSMGNNYDELLCQKGCTPDAMGCKLCDAGQTLCTNGEVQTCDASGKVTNAESCPLGCFQSEPRCREIDPSNGLATYADMVTNPPDVTITNGQFDTKTGNVSDGGTSVSVPSFEVAAPANGVAIRVFVVNSLHIQDATATSVGVDPRVATGPAIAIVSRGDISITGTFRVTGTAGGYLAAGCNGGDGTWTDRNSELTSGGGGGGANATDGARGGAITNFEAGGVKGSAAGTAALVPLRGGCPGGSSADSPGSPFNPHGGAGGGAIQLSSGTKIAISGTIDVRGSKGDDNFAQGNSGTGHVDDGGGAGGGILLEAPSVTLDGTAKLFASGGDGAGACTTSMTSCGAGGHGATSGVPAAPGADITNGGGYSVSAGAGGGGLGRIRINTPDQMYTKANTTAEDGDLSVGTVATR